ncbi:hypothetical protein [Brevibacillus parabrevis]|nr:hypothetical protein [Brevibacillus parabrevis]
MDLKKGTILRGAYRIKKTVSTSELSHVYLVYHMEAKKAHLAKKTTNSS